MENNSFGDRLKKAIKDSPYTQYQLADELGISEKTVSRYVRGETEPVFSIIQILADYLNVDHNWLAFGEPPTPPPSRSLYEGEQPKQRNTFRGAFHWSTLWFLGAIIVVMLLDFSLKAFLPPGALWILLVSGFVILEFIGVMCILVIAMTKSVVSMFGGNILITRRRLTDDEQQQLQSLLTAQEGNHEPV